MKWELAPKLRVDLACFTGINLSGERRHVDIQAVNGRQGPDVQPDELRSLVLVGPVGLRMILKTTEDDDWETKPWRVVRITKESSFKTKEGNNAVRVPDLDWLDKADARRTDPDFQECFPTVEKLADGKGWTFGREGELKGNIVAIAIHRE